MRRRTRNPATRLRFAVAALPRRTRVAMLAGLDANRIIVGAYTDPHTGGICPMLAAHRNGGRTSLASFARAWDAFTGARRPRLATRRELRALRSYLEISLLRDDQASDSISELASALRAERRRLASCAHQAQAEIASAVAAPARPQVGERDRARELRGRPGWAWLRPARHYGEFKDLLAAAEAELSERRAADLLDAPATHRRRPAATR